MPNEEALWTLEHLPEVVESFHPLVFAKNGWHAAYVEYYTAEIQDYTYAFGFNSDYGGFSDAEIG